MKQLFRFALMALAVIALAVPSFAGVIEGWTVLDTANIGTYADTNGSIIMYLTTDGPKAGEKALKIESTLKEGGYCGIWHNLGGADLAKEGAIKFMAKSTKPGEMQMALKDKWNVQYTANFKIQSTEWHEIIVNTADFTKDTTYTPPDAIKGKPMDFSETKGMNFGPKIYGDATILIGPVVTSKPGKAAPPPASKAVAKPAAAKAEVKKAVAAPAASAKAVEKASVKSAVAVSAAASGKVGGVVEPWTTVDPSNTGTYADTTGTVVSFKVAPGPVAAEKALVIDTDLKAGGFAGIWHNITGDLSKAGALVIKTKSVPPGKVQMAMKDKYNVQYVAFFEAPGDWADVNIPLGSFVKDPYYTPPDAVPGHPMDVSAVSGMNFSAQNPGKSVLSIGPVKWTEGSFAAAGAASTGAAAPVAEAPKGTGQRVVLQNFASTESGINGSYADTNGSSISYELKDAKKKGDAKDKMLSVKYKLVGGGWCGIWHRAGDGWDGVNCTNAVAVEMTVYTAKPMVIGMSLKDGTNNQYIADGPMSKGGKWETVSIPFSKFVKDPYYTPPEAIKGAPADWSKVGSISIVPKTEGEGVFAVDKIEVVK